MGGTALIQTKTRRYNASEYKQLTGKLITLIRQMHPSITIEPVRAYHNKQSFGDLDLLVQQTDDSKNQIADFLQTYNVKEIVKNGPVWSIGWNDFQVDFIFQKEFYFARNYFAWNDLGNLLGRIYNKIGFKFGHDGLWYVLRDGTHTVAKLLVTNDFHQALKFINADIARFERGFDELTDIFDYVVENDYFYKDIFLLENRNHESRTRDKKRKVYTDFLKYIDSNDKKPIPFNKDSWLHVAFNKFPEFKKHYYEAYNNHQKIKEVRNKINGNDIKELTGLNGKKLGHFIKYIYSEVNNQTQLTWSDFVLMNDLTFLRSWVSQQYDKFIEQ